MPVSAGRIGGSFFNSITGAIQNAQPGFNYGAAARGVADAMRPAPLGSGMLDGISNTKVHPSLNPKGKGTGSFELNFQIGGKKHATNVAKSVQWTNYAATAAIAAVSAYNIYNIAKRDPGMMGGSNVYSIYHSGGGGNGNNNNNPKGGNDMPTNRRKGKGKGNGNGGSGGGYGGGNGGGNGGGGGYNSGAGGIINPPTNSYPMSPYDMKQIGSFSTGINGTILAENDNHKPADKVSDLYSQSMRFNALGTTGSYVNKLWTNTIFPAYVQYCQRNLNYQFTLNIDDFGTYMEVVSDALQFYYCIESVLAYANDPETNNTAMYKLRQQITADLYNDMYLLKERLEQMVIPPMIHDMIHALYQNYSMGTVPGAPIVRFSHRAVFRQNSNNRTTMCFKYPFYDADDNTFDYTLGSTLINGYINKLAEVATVPAGATLRNLFDAWRIAIKPCPGHAIYDPQIANMWTNFPTYYRNYSEALSKNYFGNWVSTTEEDYEFSSYTNTVDGGVQCFASAWFANDSSDGNWTIGTGFVNPYVEFDATTGWDSSLVLFNEDSETWDPLLADDLSTEPNKMKGVLNAGNKVFALTDGSGNFTPMKYTPVGTQNSISLNVDLNKQPSDLLVKKLWSYDMIR